MLKLSEQDVKDLRSAIREAQAELCVDHSNSSRFPEATAYYHRLDELDHKLLGLVTTSQWP